MKHKYLILLVFILLIGNAKADNLDNLIKNNEDKCYTLTEVTKSNDGFYYDENGNKVYNIITQYVNSEPHYYNLTLNKTRYEIDGENENYFTFKKNSKGDWEFSKTNEKSSDTITAVYSPELSNERINNTLIENQNVEGLFSDKSTTNINGQAIYNDNDLHFGNITGNFINNSISYITSAQGGAIYNKNGDFKIIKGNFINNSIRSSFTHGYGGAIYSIRGTIENLEGDFIGNHIVANSGYGYGGAVAFSSQSTIDNINANFIGNYVNTQSSQGGAFYAYGGDYQTINADFIGNYAKGKDLIEGGALYLSAADVTNGINGDFIGNYAQSTEQNVKGGAINAVSSIIESIKGKFYSNEAKTNSQKSSHYAKGGAIYQYGYNANIKNIEGEFSENKATALAATASQAYTPSAEGGAIYNEGAKIDSINANFTSNKAQSTKDDAYGGAIANVNSSSINTIITKIRGIFEKNSAISDNSYAYGGAIYNTSNKTNNFTDIKAKFKDNLAKGFMAKGGAIYTTGKYTSNDSEYKNNIAKGNYQAQGGAIYASKDLSETSSTFENNEVQGPTAQGGAIYNYKTTLNLVDTQFKNNKATGTQAEGGAIYANSGTTNITAQDKNVVFEGNKTNLISNAIHAISSAVINLKTNPLREIIFNDRITGDSTGTININPLNGEGGIVRFNDIVSGNKIRVNNAIVVLGSYTDIDNNKTYGNFDNNTSLYLTNATLSTIDNEIKQDYTLKSLSSYNSKLAIDVDIVNDLSDKFDIETLSHTNKISFDEINIINDPTKTSGTINVINNATGEIFNDYAIFNDINSIHFTDGLDGNLNYTVTRNNGIKSAIDYEDGNRTYNFFHDEAVSENLGNMQGDNSYLTINGKDFTLDGKDFEGMNVSHDKTLNMNNLVVKNFKNSLLAGAINNSGILNIKNVHFSNNKSSNNAGAIYNSADGTINMEGKIKFESNNSNSNNEAIYNEGTINLLDGEIVFDDKIDGENGEINLNDGIVQFNNLVSNNTININNGIINVNGDFDDSVNFIYNSGLINFQNNVINSVNFGNLTLNNDMDLKLDADLENKQMDTISASNLTSNDHIINVSDINILKPTNEKTLSLSPFAKNIKESVKAALSNVIKYSGKDSVYSPIYKYKVNYKNGLFHFNLLGGGKSVNDYNPAIMATPVAMQTQVQASLRDSMNYSFEHLDTFTKFPYKKRFALMNADKYAISEFNNQMPLKGHLEDNGYWFRPYSVFESIDFKNGPSVDNISYGTLIGYDSKFKELKRGWNSILSSYIGYNGSSVDYSGADIYSNGAIIGLTETFYKKNFFQAFSLSTGASVGRISEMYGSDNFTALNTGFTSKTGYNFEFKEGRYIIQPMLSLSYYFSNILDYTNSANVKIKADSLNAFEIKPGLRFIANTNSGWQPYINLSMVWNTFDNTYVRANGIELPKVHLGPYFEYGLGVQKLWSENLTCFLQTMVRNGSRNGVALTFGLKWAIGKNKKENI